MDERDVPHFPLNLIKFGEHPSLFRSQAHPRADFTSVREKPCPLNKSGSPLVFASA